MEGGFVDAFHCGRLGYFCHMQRICEANLRLSPADPYLSLWRLCACLLGGSKVDFRSQFEPLLQRKEINLPAYVVYYLAKTKDLLIGGISCEELELKLNELLAGGSADKSLFHAALLSLLFDGDQTITIKICDIGLRLKDPIQKALYMNLKLLMDSSKNSDDVTEVLAKDNVWPHYITSLVLKDIDPSKSSDLCSQAMVLFPRQLCFLMLRADIEFHKGSLNGITESLSDLDEFWKTCNYNQKQGLTFIEVRRIEILSSISIEGNISKLDSLLKYLFQVIRTEESENASLVYKIFFQIMNISPFIPRSILVTMINTSDSGFVPTTSVSYMVKGTLYFLSGDFEKAILEFDRAVSLDGGNLVALERKLLSKIERGLEMNGIEKEIDFQIELGKSSKKTGNQFVKFLEYKLKHCSGIDVRVPLETLMAACVNDKNDLFGIFQMVRLYYKQIAIFGLSPSTEHVMANVVNPYFQKKCPSSVGTMFVKALFEFSQKKFLQTDLFCSQCLANDSSFVEAYILKAEAQIGLGKFGSAAQTLDMCASANFSVRNQLDFGLVRSSILCKMSQFIEAESALQIVFEGAKTIMDRFQVFSKFYELYFAKNDGAKAAKYVQLAEESLSPSSSLRLLIVVNKAELALQLNNDVQYALNILNNVRFDNRSPDLYIQSREKLAEIYKTKLKDSSTYIRVYEDLIKTVPSLESHLRLVDAYVIVSEDQKAMKMLKNLKTLFRDSIESILEREVDIYVKRLDFNAALRVVQDTIVEFGDSSHLKLYLAKIMFISGNMDEFDAGDITSGNSAYQLAILYMQGKHLFNKSKLKEAVIFLEKALFLTKSLKKKSETLIQGKSVDLYLSDIARCLLITYRRLGDIAKAMSILADFNHESWSDEEVFLVFDIYLLCGEGETFLQSVSKSRSQPTILLLKLKLSLQQKKFQQCVELCKNILDINPYHQDAMWLLPETSFRMSIDLNSLKFTDSPSGPCKNHHESCSCSFSQGLLKLYENQFDSAFRHLMKLKGCEKFSDAACQRLYDAILSRNSIELGDEFVVRNSQTIEKERIKDAEFLLQEFVLSGERRKVLELDMRLLLSKSRNETEQLCKELEVLIAGNNRCFSGIFTLTRCLLRLGGGNQYLKAKSYLQDLTQMHIVPEEMYDYEKCLLVYAQLLIATSKFNFASDLLNELLVSNPKSFVVHECIGLLKEKSNDINSAITSYEKSWKLAGCKSSQTAIRLSYLQLNAKKYVEAIDTANSIRSDAVKEVLDKSRQQIRI